MLPTAGVAIIFVLACSQEITHAGPPACEFDFDNLVPTDAPQLVAILGADDRRDRERARLALVKLGRPAIPSLIEGLRREQPFGVLMNSASVLEGVGPPAIPSLLHAVGDIAYDQRRVIETLASIRPSSDEVVRALICLLKTETRITRAPFGPNVPQPDSICWVRSTARITALNNIGLLAYRDHAAKALVPVLLTLLDDRDHRVRSHAREYLGIIDPDVLFPNEREVPEVRDARELAARARDADEVRSRQEAWSQRLAQPREIVNSIGMRMVLVPPGEFVRGSPTTEGGRDEDEGPQRVVRITRPFYLGVYEVTQAEYEQVMGENPSWFSKGGRFEAQVAGMDTDRFPVEGVPWPDATEFCERLSSFSEEEAAGRIYRLPTEAEWEYAARAGTTTPFHFGAVLTGHQANIDGRYPYGTSDDSPHLGRPTAVGSYAANALGLHDMHGNVWEWCSDWYSRTYYETSSTEDPAGPTGYYITRVIRGGGWNSFGRFTRSAYRRPYASMILHTWDVGFRVVFSVAQEPDD